MVIRLVELDGRRLRKTKPNLSGRAVFGRRAALEAGRRRFSDKPLGPPDGKRGAPIAIADMRTGVVDGAAAQRLAFAQDARL